MPEWLTRPIASYRKRREAEQRALALVRLRWSLNYLGCDAEPLSDEDLEALAKHMGVLAERLMTSKRLMIARILDCSKKAAEVA